MWETVKLHPCGCEVIKHPETLRVRELPCTMHGFKTDDSVPACPVHGANGMRCHLCTSSKAGRSTSERKRRAVRRNFRIATLVRLGKPVPKELRRPA